MLISDLTPYARQLIKPGAHKGKPDPVLNYFSHYGDIKNPIGSPMESGA